MDPRDNGAGNKARPTRTPKRVIPNIQPGGSLRYQAQSLRRLRVPPPATT